MWRETERLDVVRVDGMYVYVGPDKNTFARLYDMGLVEDWGSLLDIEADEAAADLCSA